MPARLCSGTEEGETWAFLQTHFEGDGRRYLLQKLGFEDELPAVEEPPAPEVGRGCIFVVVGWFCHPLFCHFFVDASMGGVAV